MDAFLGIKDTLTNTISHVAIEKNEISVYPNPLSGNELNIKLTGLKGTTTVSLLNINGQVINSNSFAGKVLFVMKNLKLQPGIYFVAVDNAEQKLMKLIIVK